MLNPPTVSVVLTSYNHKKYIGQAIKSILDQDYKDIELIIIDDNSSDRSIEEIGKFTDSRIRFFPNSKNLGMAPRVNEGIKLSRGKYIAHMNSDDVWIDKSKITQQVNFLENNQEYGVVFTRANLINNDGKVKNNRLFYTEGKNQTRHEWLNHFFAKGNCLCYPSSLIRKSVFDKVGLYDPRYSVLLDFDMWIRILICGYEIHVLDLVAINFRDDICSYSFNEKSLGDFEYRTVLDNFLRISYDDFQKIFNFSDKNITDQNYFAYLLKVCLTLENHHNDFAIKHLYDLMKNTDYPEIQLSYKDFIKLIKKYLKDQQELSLRSKPIGIWKILNFVQYLRYKNYKKKYHIFLSPRRQFSYYKTKYKNNHAPNKKP